MRVASQLGILDGRSGSLGNPRSLRDLARTACGFALSGLLLGSVGCQNQPDASGPVGGAVSGALDTHCQGMAAQPTNQSSCHAVIDMAGAGIPDLAGTTPEPPYGDTQYNAEGNDDDCKYHLKFTTTPVRKNTPVTFTVTTTSLMGNQAVAGAAIEPEVFLSDTHPAPNSGSSTKESPAGTYVIGPITFDAAGMWTVRFHLFENCTDALSDSPHGHVAFYINVP